MNYKYTYCTYLVRRRTQLYYVGCVTSQSGNQYSYVQ